LQFDIEDEDDVTSLPLLSNNYLLRSIDDEVATLIIKALLILDNHFVVVVTEMAQLGPDHYGNLAKFYPTAVEFFDELSRGSSFSLTLFDVKVYSALYLVSEISYSGFMRMVGVVLSTRLIPQVRLLMCVYLTKFADIADLIIFELVMALFSRQELTVNYDDIVLVLSDAIRDCVLHKLVVRLNLLVDNTILIEEGINNFPLVIYVNLHIGSFKATLRQSITCMSRCTTTFLYLQLLIKLSMKLILLIFFLV